MLGILTGIKRCRHHGARLRPIVKAKRMKDDAIVSVTGLIPVTGYSEQQAAQIIRIFHCTVVCIMLPSKDAVRVYFLS